MVQAHNIKKTYGEVNVLKGVDISVKNGDFFTIVGKSGAGKSTLLHILGALESPDEGKILIDDTDIGAFNEKDLASFRNKTIGFIFQFHHLLNEFTAKENVMIPALISGSKDAEKNAKTLLDRMGLSHRFDHKPNQLSGGEQQRVAIARALVNQPKLILADEPTGNLDSQTSEEIHLLLKEIQKDLNTSMIIVTHSTELAALSDEQIVMKDGVIISE